MAPPSRIGVVMAQERPKRLGFRAIAKCLSVR
jgi:hypothetical protein